MEETSRLEKIPYDTLKKEVGAFAQPFALLLDRIQTDYSQFALAQPRQADSHQVLAKKFELLRWYIDKALSTQAILLAREWVVSALCIRLNLDYLQKQNREIIEANLNNLIEQMKDRKSDGEPENVLEQVVPDLDKLSKLWSELRSMRNDLAHTEMRSDSLSASAMTKFVREELIAGLSELFRDSV